MKKLFLFMSLVFGALGAFGETAVFNFEAVPLGALNGQDGWSATESVLVTETQVADTTNCFSVADWFSYGKRTVEMTGESEFSRSFAMASGKEQRVAFDFYVTYPETLANKSAVVSLGSVPVIRFRQTGWNEIRAEVYGSYFGDDPSWHALPGVKPLFDRK